MLVLRLKIFFLTAKFDNFKDEKISDCKTASVPKRKNLLDQKLVVQWDYEQLLRGVFLSFGGQKKIFNFFFKFFSNRIEKLHKMAFIIFFFFLKKFEKVEKTGFFRAKFLLHCTLSVILGTGLSIKIGIVQFSFGKRTA